MLKASTGKEGLEEKRRAKFERHHKNVLWWNKHLPDMTVRYPGQCVAVYDERIVGVSSDYQELVSEVKAKGYTLTQTVIEYVHPDRITVKPVMRMGEPSEEEKARIGRYNQDAIWLEGHLDELREEYLDCWVGVYRKRIVGANPDLRELLAELRAKGYYPGEIAYEYIKADATPRYWIYTPYS